MQSAIEIISEACRTFGLQPPKSFSDTTNETSRRLLSALNRTAEELSIEHNWLQQCRQMVIPLDKNPLYYNSEVHGYDIMAMTNNSFARFTGSHLYNITQKVEIPGVPLDLFQKESPLASENNRLMFFRYNNFLLFFPDITGIEVGVYYQTIYTTYYKNNIAEVIESDMITRDDHIPYHNPRLLLRGVLLKYALHKNFDTTQYETSYKDYKDKIIASEVPQSAFGFMNKYIRAVGRDIYIG